MVNLTPRFVCEIGSPMGMHPISIYVARSDFSFTLSVQIISNVGDQSNLARFHVRYFLRRFRKLLITYNIIEKAAQLYIWKWEQYSILQIRRWSQSINTCALFKMAKKSKVDSLT